MGRLAVASVPGSPWAQAPLLLPTLVALRSLGGKRPRVTAFPGRLWSHGPACPQAFNTFIDDVFAFIITMPTSHRLACFRDDVVFLVYLYQRW